MLCAHRAILPQSWRRLARIVVRSGRARRTERWPEGGPNQEALRSYSRQNGWKVAVFEGSTGAPRTGIIDAIAFRLGRKSSDLLDVRLVQLKGGNAGVTAREIARLKQAAAGAVPRRHGKPSKFVRSHKVGQKQRI